MALEERELLPRLAEHEPAPSRSSVPSTTSSAATSQSWARGSIYTGSPCLWPSSSSTGCMRTPRARTPCSIDGPTASCVSEDRCSNAFGRSSEDERHAASFAHVRRRSYAVRRTSSRRSLVGKALSAVDLERPRNELARVVEQDYSCLMGFHFTGAVSACARFRSSRVVLRSSVVTSIAVPSKATRTSVLGNVNGHSETRNARVRANAR